MDATYAKILEAVAGGSKEEAFVPQAFNVHVTVVEASDVVPRNQFTNDNFFCVCKVKGHSDASFETKPLDDTLNPQWNEDHVLHNWTVGDDLEFSVHNKGIVGSRIEGKALLRSDDFYPKGFEGELKLAWSSPTGAKVRVRVAVPTKCTEIDDGNAADEVGQQATRRARVVHALTSKAGVTCSGAVAGAAVCAATGGTVGAGAGAVTGGTVGTVAGAAVGVPFAIVTLGASIPVCAGVGLATGAATGGAIGAGAGATAGGTVGAVGGATTGYVGYAYRHEIKEKTEDGWEFACAATESLKAKTETLKAKAAQALRRNSA